MAYVNIVASDRGWILESMARAIASRLDYVRFADQADPDAALQYYITYSARRARVSPIEVACFTHREDDPGASARFAQVAQEVEHCICMAAMYERQLRDLGVENVSTIRPGVDLDRFTVGVRIGVIGRTYHTGRKGEALVAAVMDEPGIEWCFTGDGWPGPALNIPDDGLAQFYRTLDYVLVPATIEGGPMCVIEALACGVPVIASDVGWVPEFENITRFRSGDADDLRRVLRDVVGERLRLRAEVERCTWDRWAEGHDRVFTALLAKHPDTRTIHAPKSRRPIRSVALALHGNEASTLGGPSVRVPRTARELSARNIPAQTFSFFNQEMGGAGLIHGFNIWAPASSLELARWSRSLGKPYVFSPILLDLSQRPYWHEELPQAFALARSRSELDDRLEAAAIAEAERIARRVLQSEPVPGFGGIVRELAGSADHFVFLSELERSLLLEFGVTPRASSLVRNPIDAEPWAGADPNLFRDAYPEVFEGFEHGDYVICVARIETRKNQLMLVEALRDFDAPLVLAGHAANQGYLNSVRRWAGPNLRILDRLPPGSDLLRSAVAGARVAVLASWAEGASLAALEAGAAGTALVLKSRSGEAEYFRDAADYCDPASRTSIREAVERAWSRSGRGRAAMQRLVRDSFSWDRHIAALGEVYHSTLESFTQRPAAHVALPRSTAARPFILDVTTTAHRKGRMTGISRVESEITTALQAVPDLDLRIIGWSTTLARFIEFPRNARASDIVDLLAVASPADPSPHFPAGGQLLVPGSAWMQNARYANAVAGLAADQKLDLNLFVYDIVPVLFPWWMPEGYADLFEKNLRLLVTSAQRILCDSVHTQRDVERYAAKLGLGNLRSAFLRLGDQQPPEARADGGGTPAVSTRFGGRRFVLNVGAIHVRKNQKLLYDLWVELVGALGPKCPDLVIVGGVGWNGAETARMMREDTRLRGKLHILDDIDDASLEWLYGNCLFTVYPSLYEGWGLPVSESLNHGKPCIASATSSIPEIAPALTDLIDPNDFPAWLARIRLYATSRTTLQQRSDAIRASYRPRGWAAVAGDLVGLIDTVEPRPTFLPVYALGTIAPLSEKRSEEYRAGYWHTAEPWGSWSSGTAATIRLRLSSGFEGDLVLSALARVGSTDVQARTCEVFVNGVRVSTWRLLDREGYFFAIVPGACIGPDGIAEITFRNSALAPLAASDKNKAKSAGIGVASFAISRAGLDPLPYASHPSILRKGSRVDFLMPSTAAELFADAAAHIQGWGIVGVASLPLKLRLNVVDQSDETLDVRIHLRACAQPEFPVSVLVLVDGAVAYRVLRRDSIPFSCDIGLTAAQRRNSPVEITIATNPVQSPQAIGLGTVVDVFGVAVQALHVAGEDPMRRPVRPLRVGECITFASAALPGERQGTEFLDHGWHPTERSGVWMATGSAGLRLRTFEPPPNASLRLGLRGILTASLGPYDVSLALGGEVLGTFSITVDNVMEVDVVLSETAARALANEALLEITAQRVGIPSLHGRAAERRALALMLCWAGVVDRDAPRFTRTVSFRFDTPPGAVFDERWHAAELDGRWSSGERAQLGLPLGPSALGSRDIAMRVKGRVFGTAHLGPATLRVFVDQLMVHEEVVASDLIHDFPFTIPSNALRADGTVALVFEREGARSPNALGISPDLRVLGFMVVEIATDIADIADRAARAAPAEAAATAAAPGESAPGGGSDEQGGHESGDIRISLPGFDANMPASFPDAGRFDGVPFANGGGMNGGAGRHDDTERFAGAVFDERWHAAELDGRWSSGERAQLGLPLGPSALGSRDIAMRVKGRVFGTAHLGPATLRVFVDQLMVHEEVVASDLIHDFPFTIPSNALRADGTVALVFEREGARSPNALGISPDLRVLGFMVVEIATDIADRAARAAPAEAAATAAAPGESAPGGA